MLRLIVRHDGRVYQLDAPEGAALLGADPSSDIHLPLPGVSRRHAQVEPSARGLRIRDLGSKNGLVMGGVRLSALELRPGDRIFIGRAEVTLEEVGTGDGVVSVALSRARPARAQRDGSTASEGVPGLPGAPAGLAQLVREFSASPRGNGAGAAADLLERTAAGLGARHLFFLSRADGRARPGRVLGDPVPPRLIDAAGQQTLALPDRATRRISAGGVPPFFLRSALQAENDLVAAVVLDSAPEALEPWQEDLLDLLLNAVHRGHGRAGTPGLTEDPLVYPPGFLPPRSAAMTRLLTELQAAVASELDVLLLGETGTGKELLAEMVHASGPTRSGPFIPVNCAAIPSELLEAELFGVKARVATGVDPRQGLLVRARGGCVFLDEIGDMPLSLQAKLLRALEEREVWPVGGHQPEPIHVRVISSTNRNLPALVRDGQFRSDLYYRLRGLQLELPPLRQRPDDISELAAHFAARAAQAYGRDVAGISMRAVELLLAHDWPGNVRELKTTVERAVLSCPNGGVLSAAEFEPSLRVRLTAAHAASAEPSAPEGRSLSLPLPEVSRDLSAQVKALERRIIGDALTRFDGNKSKAARHLGITRNGLALKMRRLGIASAREAVDD